MFVFFLIISFFCVHNQNLDCKKSLEESVSKNPYIFEAEIVEIYESSEVWSESAIFNYQKVKYKVNKTFKGEEKFDEIEVAHAIYKGSPLVEKDKPKLSSTFFYKGQKYILLVEQIDSKNQFYSINQNEFVVTDSECYVLTANKEIIDNIENLLKK